MAKFTFKNIADTIVVPVGDEATISPSLVYNSELAYKGASDDLAIKATAIRLPVFSQGFHQLVVINPGETFTVETDDVAAVAFYTNLANSLGKDLAIEAVIEEGANPVAENPDVSA